MTRAEAGEDKRCRVAYLNSKYPSLSHTFIEREIRAVRAAGVEVHPFSVRPAGAVDRLDETHRRAAEEAFVLFPGVMALVLGGVLGLAGRFWRLPRAVATMWGVSPTGVRGRVSGVAQVLEAAVLAREMRRRRLRHVHVHMGNSGAAVPPIACALDPMLSYSITIHGSAEFFELRGQKLREKCAGATLVRCISEFCRAQVMIATPPESWDRLAVVRCGVDVSSFAFREPRTAGPLTLLSVGRMTPIKGHLVLLEACAGLTNIDWRLRIVGTGPMEAAVRREAARLGVAERVEFVGAVGPDGLPALYASADVLVVSSFMEGLPVVIMEALATGTAVVSTAVAGVPEIIEDGVTGFLARPGSADSLRAAIQRLADRRDTLPEMARRGREVAERECDARATGARMAALLGGSAPARLETADRARSRTPALMSAIGPIAVALMQIAVELCRTSIGGLMA